MPNVSKIVIQIILIVTVIAVAIYATRFVSSSEIIQGYVAEFGLLIVLLAGLVSGFNVLIPIPGPALVPIFLESGMDFMTVVIVMTVGLTIADLFGFLIGKTGRELTPTWREARWVKRVQELKERKPFLVLILLFVFASTAPLPNEVVVIPLAYIGFKARELLLPLFLGHIVFVSWASYGLAEVYSFFL